MANPTRYYSSNAAKTTLSNSITSTSTSLELAAAANLPTQYPYTLILEKDTANEEVVEVTSKTGTAYNITRNIDNSGAKGHAIGANVEHGVSARDFTESRAHEAATTAHGVTGDVVGTGGAQAIVGVKTMTSPVLTGTPVITGLSSTGMVDSSATPKNYVDAFFGPLTSAVSSAAAASSSALAASSSALSASNSAANALTSAASAALSATSATASASSATASASSALASAATAATSAATAVSSAATATTQAGIATTSAALAVSSVSSAALSATNASNSAAAALTSANNAATSASSAANSASSMNASVIAAASSATAASSSATAAASSALTASTSASISLTSAATAVTSAATAISSAATAVTSAGQAATSAASAATSATSAAASATTASNSAATAVSSAATAVTSAATAVSSAATATTSAAQAVTSATSAATSASSAATSATSAAASATSAAASYDSFDDRYLGSKASAPTLDNDGNTLLVGAIYWNSTDGKMYVWSGSAWVQIAAASAYSTPTIGTTAIDSGATVTTISNVTLADASLQKSAPALRYVGLSPDNGQPWVAKYSNDGITWNSATVTGNVTGEYWYSSTYGNGKFVALAESKVIYSTDGANWTLGTTLPSQKYWAALSYGNGKFVALPGFFGTSNQAIYSTDGITWALTSLPSSQTWGAMTYANGKFVALAGGEYGSNTTAAAYSTDGITWTASTLPTSAKWVSVTYGNGKYVAIATGSSAVAYSTDGITWTATTNSSSDSWNSIAFGNGVFVAAKSSSSSGSYSTDGITWVSRSFGTTAQDVFFADGKFSTSYQYGPNFATSTDGVTWQISTANVDLYFAGNISAGLATVLSSGTLTVNGSTGTSGQVLQTTGTGVQWATPASPLPAQSLNINLVANWLGGNLSPSFGLTRFGSGGFDVTGDSNDYLLLNTIPNGVTFTAYDSQNNPGLFVKNANAVSGVTWDVTWVSGAQYYTGYSVYGLSYSGSNAGKLLGTNGTTAAWTSTLTSPNFENGIKPKIGITLSSGNRGFSYYDGNALSTEVFGTNIYFKGIQKVGNVWIGASLSYGSIYPHSSTDGITWTSLGYAGNGNSFNNYSNNKVAHNGTCFLVIGGNYGGTAGIFKTTNITDYAQIVNPPTFTNSNYIADTTVTSYNGYFLIPDYLGSSLFYSTDGDNWNTATLPTAAQWTSTVYGAGKYVVVARNSQTAAYATTPSGPWTSITMPHSGYQSLIHDGSKFIAMGSGALATSTDGVTWTSQTFTESGWWNMAYSNGSYVATNMDTFINYILVSTNGTTWTQYYTPDAAYGHRSIGLVTTQPASGTLSINGNSGTSGQSLVSTGTGIKWGAPASATPTVAGSVAGQVDQLNTAIGTNAVDTSILAGTYNIGVGQGALRYCTTGGGNVIASHAGTYITTGSGNVGVGDGTLYGMQTGSNNTAIGNYAASGASGSDSTAVGYYAGNRGGTGNSSFGSQAGMYTQGTNNTFIGANAGKVPSAFSDYTNQNVTVLGANSVQSSKTVNNEITLGNAAITTIRAAVTSITSISDERDKTAIEPLTVGLDFVNELKPVQFEWNMRDGGKVGQLDAGFIAQDLVVAEDATGLADYLQLTMRENPDKLEATQGRLIPILVKAIQELSAEVKALKEGK